ncbi:hypothetical protein [Labilithrix luteola]|nr:hypothetical protein [Labilithrix luteola]
MKHLDASRSQRRRRTASFSVVVLVCTICFGVGFSVVACSSDDAESDGQNSGKVTSTPYTPGQAAPEPPLPPGAGPPTSKPTQDPDPPNPPKDSGTDTGSSGGMDSGSGDSGDAG